MRLFAPPLARPAAPISRPALLPVLPELLTHVLACEIGRRTHNDSMSSPDSSHERMSLTNRESVDRTQVADPRITHVTVPCAIRQRDGLIHSFGNPVGVQFNRCARHFRAVSPCACLNAVRPEFHAGSFSSPPMSTPIRRKRSAGCCPRATSGDAAVLPSPAMNSRRLVHSITWSATASRFGGMVRPSPLAVLRLMTNSNLFEN